MGWGVSTSIEYVLVKFLHIYGTSTPCKDMRSTYQYTRGTKSWPPMQSQLHNHGEGLLKISIHVASVQAASASHCSAASLASPSLTSFRRKFQVHFPEFRAAGHTEECAAPRTDAQCAVCSVQCAVCTVRSCTTSCTTNFEICSGSSWAACLPSRISHLKSIVL